VCNCKNRQVRTALLRQEAGYIPFSSHTPTIQAHRSKESSAQVECLEQANCEAPLRGVVLLSHALSLRSESTPELITSCAFMLCHLITHVPQMPITKSFAGSASSTVLRCDPEPLKFLDTVARCATNTPEPNHFICLLAHHSLGGCLVLLLCGHNQSACLTFCYAFCKSAQHTQLLHYASAR
jgi:hypothetical protein